MNPRTGRIRTLRLAGEGITSSFAVDETGGVYVVSDRALYRFDAGRGGWPLRRHNGQRRPDAGRGLPARRQRDRFAKGLSEDTDDPRYLTAIDFRTGETVFKRLAGFGLGFNNNYAPVTIGPTGTAYVGVLGGLVALRDWR